MATNACNDCGCALHECECMGDVGAVDALSFEEWSARWKARAEYIKGEPTSLSDEVLHAMYDDRVEAAQEEALAAARFPPRKRFSIEREIPIYNTTYASRSSKR